MIDFIGRLAGEKGDFAPLKQYVMSRYHQQVDQVGVLSMIRGVPYEYFVKTKSNGNTNFRFMYFGNDGSSRVDKTTTNFDESFVKFLVSKITPNVMVREQFYIALKDNINYAYQSKLKDLDAAKILALRMAEKTIYGNISDPDNIRK